MKTIKVVFEIKESVEDIFAQLSAPKITGMGNIPVIFVEMENSHFGCNYELVDTDWGCAAKISVYKWGESLGNMEIETYWSKFLYRIETRSGITTCTYEGSYRGLLSQNLLPTLTPTGEFLNARTESEGTNTYASLAEYAQFAQEIYDLRMVMADKGMARRPEGHCHPRCIWDTGWRPASTITASQKTEI